MPSSVTRASLRAPERHLFGCQKSPSFLPCLCLIPWGNETSALKMRILIAYKDFCLPGIWWGRIPWGRRMLLKVSSLLYGRERNESPAVKTFPLKSVAKQTNRTTDTRKTEGRSLGNPLATAEHLPELLSPPLLQVWRPGCGWRPVSEGTIQRALGF